MALALADNEARWNPVELPKSLSKAGLPRAGRSKPTGTLARESVLEKQDECSIQGQVKFSKLIPHMLVLERYKADEKKYLEEKAREIEREQRVSSFTGAGGNAKDAARQTVLLPPLMMGKMFFDRMKFSAMRSLDERSFLVDVMLHICNEKEQEDVDEFKNAIAVVKMVIGDFKIKLNRIEYIYEMTEEEMTLLDSSLERAWDNLLERMESTRNFDEAAAKPYRTEANCACYAIGLKVDFLHRLDFDQIPQHWVEHLSIEEWICNSLGENYKREKQQEPECVSRSSKETLEQMGFRSDVAKTIVERASTMEKHLPTLHWAELYVRDEFKYNPMLSGIIRHDNFPFFPYARKEWQVFPMEKVDGDNENYRELYVLNLERRPNSTSYPKQDGSCSFPQDLEDETHRVLFHGTDHDSARDIFTHGVRVTQGRKNRDFSSGCGFYLTDDFEHAVEWAFCSTRKPAVLVYRVERSQLESFAGYSLVGEGARNKWVDLVKQYRSGKPTKKLRKSLRECDFVEGPRSFSCDAISPEPKEGTYQMCVISSKLAETLDDRSLHSAVFYDG